MEHPPTHDEHVRLYIVIQTHTLDYISSTVYLTEATNEHEAIISCMKYGGDLAFDNEEEEVTELVRLRSLSLYDLEQSDRENGNTWSAETLIMPQITSNRPVVQIAKLNTD